MLKERVTTVEMEVIPPELIFTGIKLVPVSNHTMNRRGSARVDVVGVDDKRLITAIFCASVRRFLASTRRYDR